jgi:ATP-binding cassette subfamily B protein
MEARILNHTERKTKLLILLKFLWHHLRPRRQRQFKLLLSLVLVSSLVEVVSLGSVLPFLGILSAPDLVFNHPLAFKVIRNLGITSPEQLVLPLTTLFITLALLAGTIRILFLRFSSRLAFASGTDLSVEVYHRTLHQSYSTHMARNSSELLSVLTTKIQAVVYGVLYPLLNMVSSIALVVAVSVTLIVINPMIALIVAAIFGASYYLITKSACKILKQNGEHIANEQTKAIKVMQEGLGGIRDILLDGTQQAYCNAYEKADYQLKRAQGDNLFISASPRLVIEALAMTLIATLAYIMSHQSGGINEAIPILGAIALGAQRLLPALQQSYNSWATIVNTQASLADTIELLNQSISENALQIETKPLTFQQSIQFKNLRFRYSPSSPWVLDGVSLDLAKGSRTGIIGSTGGGKSTLMDLLMGLLYPTEGSLQVDKQLIGGKKIQAWQKNIAHVPQNIYLADASFTENIAFCVTPENVNMDLLRQVAHQAQIANFIENQPEGYNTFVGERGVRLSGGQQQRIGIARALYKQASVLIFDEATSALDNETERAIMETIESLKKEFTIVIIAHRLSTLKNCDTIIELKSGQVVKQGTFEQFNEMHSKTQ